MIKLLAKLFDLELKVLCFLFCKNSSNSLSFSLQLSILSGRPQMNMFLLYWVIDIFARRSSISDETLSIVDWWQEWRSILANSSLTSRNLSSGYLSVSGSVIWLIAHLCRAIFIEIRRSSENLIESSWISIRYLLLEGLIPAVLFPEGWSWRVMPVKSQSFSIRVLEQTVILMLDKVF